MTSGRVRGGFNQYGFTVGILMLDTRFPRIQGDMGNAGTFPFPVRYHRVSGADPDLVVRRGAEGLLPAFVAAGRSQFSPPPARLGTTPPRAVLAPSDVPPIPTAVLFKELT